MPFTSFFGDEPEPKPQSGGSARTKAANNLDRNHTGCDTCPLKVTWGALHSPRMPLSYEPNETDVLVFGEGPGEEEDRLNRQFVGKSGKFLRGAIPPSHLSRVGWQNTVRCRPPSNRTPTRTEMHACSDYLDADINTLKPKAILAVGDVALQRLLLYDNLTSQARSVCGISSLRGIFFPVEVRQNHVKGFSTVPYWAMATYHPAAVICTTGEYGESAIGHLFRSDLRYFFNHVDHLPHPVIADLNPVRVTVCMNEEDAKCQMSQLPGMVAVDIETVELRPYERNARPVSGAISNGTTTISFPIDGVDSWGMRLMLHTISNRRWIAHNAAFELLWFLFAAKALGINDNFYRFDDTQALGRLYHERASLLSLAILSRIHLGVDVKTILNIDRANIVRYKPEELLRYNGLDALATVMIHQKLRAKVDSGNYARLLATVHSVTQMELYGLNVWYLLPESFANTGQTSQPRRRKRRMLPLKCRSSNVTCNCRSTSAHQRMSAVPCTTLEVSRCR